MNECSKENIRAILSFEELLPDISKLSREEFEADKRILQLLSLLLKNNFTFPFDYPAWLSEMGIKLDNIDDLDSYDLETLRKVMTANVRMDRFVEGHLYHLVSSGYFSAFFNALKKYS